jgi:hypothetical protein
MLTLDVNRRVLSEQSERTRDQCGACGIPQEEPPELNVMAAEASYVTRIDRRYVMARQGLLQLEKFVHSARSGKRDVAPKPSESAPRRSDAHIIPSIPHFPIPAAHAPVAFPIEL